MSKKVAKESFAGLLIAWQKKEGRQDLPWQQTRSPYERWVAEIMLQQTQVAKVTEYYRRFIAHFPSVESLAAATEDEVLSLWSGLGYYSRARNLLLAAQTVVKDGGFPDSPESWAALPGVGRSTAGAIFSAVSGKPAVMLDANAKRVIARVSACREESPASRDKALWAEAARLLPEKEGDIYSQALMDLGSMVCTAAKPACLVCPAASLCRGLAAGNPLEYTKKSRGKEKPERHVFLLVDADEHGAVLEKRKSSGVWGGLWSLPESAEPPEGSIVISVFPHVFSHFRLTMTALRTPVPEQENRRRFTPDEIQKGPLPAPIKDFLLREVFRSGSAERQASGGE
jgi:A/G-specific adenine glycosylase